MIRQGKFKPHNPLKYKGNPSQIFYRSGWERTFMSYLDNHSEILEWSSEEIGIPYISAVDGTRHLYFPDFFVKYLDKGSKIRCMISEVKPSSQCIPPSGGQLPQKNKKIKQSKKYIKETLTYATNISKWTAAQRYCAQRGWDFRIITENELYGTQGVPHGKAYNRERKIVIPQLKTTVPKRKIRAAVKEVVRNG